MFPIDLFKKNKDGKIKEQSCLRMRFQYTRSLPPGNIRKPLGFLMFSGGREKGHWERMG